MGKSSDIVTGYEYYLGVQMALCQGPIDSITQVVVGERIAWEGEIDTNESVYIDKPELFGGETREGGVQGVMTATMGDSPTPDPYLQIHAGPNVPAYIGVCTVIFKAFLWSKVNPYFKAPWFKYKRIIRGWSRGGTVWYPEKAQIGEWDMNPAHILYQCITDTIWGMGYAPGDVDETSFMLAADQLHAEGFGMSLEWSLTMTIEAFVQIICNTINGGWDLDLRTGKFKLKLIRDITDPDSLLELNPDNILDMSSFQRVAWGEQANRVIVRYTDREQNQQTVTVENMAAIEAIGGAEITATKEYLGIREESLALRVAMRDLNTSSAPLAKVTLTTNQVLWGHGIGDPVALTWPKLGLDKIPFRILAITKTDLDDGSIRVELVEDVFGLPTGTYVNQQPTLWIDPVQPPIPIQYAVAVEAPYWDVVRRMSAADFEQLTPGYGFGEVYAVKPTSDAFNFRLMSSPDNITYTQVNSGYFAASGTLVDAVSRTADSFEIENTTNLGQADIGTYAYVNGELVLVESVDEVTGLVQVGRAVLDTVPVEHAAGSRIYFSGIDKGVDPNEHVLGESEYYKPLTQNGLGTSDIASATALLVNFNQRADRPYPPGNVKLNDDYFPALSSGGLTLTWAHRNRLTQTADLIPFETGNIGPEPGTTYRVRIYNGSTLVRTYAAIASTSQVYSETDAITDGILQTPRIVIDSQRDGLDSYQAHDFTVTRAGLGFRLGVSLGGVAP